MNGYGIVTAVICFVCIGIFHPIVIKAEYYLSARCWPLFLLAGIVFLAASLMIGNLYLAGAGGPPGSTCPWSTRE